MRTREEQRAVTSYKIALAALWGILIILCGMALYEMEQDDKKDVQAVGYESGTYVVKNGKIQVR